jgi:hypothetical protein
VLYPPGNGTLYRGVFLNSNQMGSHCATMSAGLFILLIGAWSEKKMRGIYCLYLLLC